MDLTKLLFIDYGVGNGVVPLKMPLDASTYEKVFSLMAGRLHVISVITNPVEFQSRYRLFREFQKYMSQFQDVIHWTVEGIYPGQDYRVTERDNPYHLQVELEHELWHKENLLNLLVEQRLNLHPEHRDWEYVAWIDADIVFARPDWAQATILKLQEHPVVQMFSECFDLDSHCQMVGSGKDSGRNPGMIHLWERGGFKHTAPYSRYGGHCGYAWAMRRDAWEILGGLLDFSIVGSADYQMACALMGDIMRAIHYRPPQGYRDALEAWGERAKRLPGRVGSVPGLCLHHWHGPKSSRGYNWRTRILTDNGFDPQRDLTRQANGAYRWHVEHPDHAVALHDELKAYFRSRDEDLSSEG